MHHQLVRGVFKCLFDVLLEARIIEEAHSDSVNRQRYPKFSCFLGVLFQGRVGEQAALDGPHHGAGEIFTGLFDILLQRGIGESISESLGYLRS